MCGTCVKRLYQIVFEIRLCQTTKWVFVTNNISYCQKTVWLAGLLNDTLGALCDRFCNVSSLFTLKVEENKMFVFYWGQLYIYYNIIYIWYYLYLVGLNEHNSKYIINIKSKTKFQQFRTLFVLLVITSITWKNSVVISYQQQ